MVKRLISFSELDEIEGLVEHPRKVRERLEVIEADAAQFDVPAQDVSVLAQKTFKLARDLATLLERILERVEK